MKKELFKVIENGTELIKVVIETENNYFSITGTIGAKVVRGQMYNDYIQHNKQKYEIHSGGCIHEDILKHIPHLQPIVNLHLSNLEGVPMHAVANGTYWFKEDKNKGLNYVRYKGSREGINTIEDFKGLFPKLYIQYNEEAEEVLELIEKI